MGNDIETSEPLWSALFYHRFKKPVGKMKKEENKGNKFIVRNECLLLSVSG